MDKLILISVILFIIIIWQITIKNRGILHRFLWPEFGLFQHFFLVEPI